MQHFITSLFFVLTLLTTSFAQTKQPPYAITKSIKPQRGAVVCAHPAASEVGASILRQGGNAFDAVIATQLALAVVYPNAGNIGGGGMLIAHTARGQNICIDYREKAPALATRDMYLDSTGNPIPGKSLNGHLASGVPGTVAGLFATLPYAKLPFRQLINPAIHLAEKGFALTKAQADSLNRHRNQFLAQNLHPTAFTREIPWAEGDTLFQPELATTLKRIREQGAAGFYDGETAHLMVSEMQAGGGLISRTDLKNYRAVVREAMNFPYRGYQVVSMPLPSSGGLILAQLLGIMEQYDLGRMGFHSPASIQLMVEAERRAYADRAYYYGDPDFVKVPVKELLSAPYLRKRMNDFTPGQAGSSNMVKEGQVGESNETTHISIVDAYNNAVSVTTTLNGYYGSKTVVHGAGFLLNNEMDDFSVKPGIPNLFGVTGQAANAIAPGKRMLSSMTPTIVLKNNKPVIITGSPGGSTIPTSVFQTLVNLIDFSLSPEDAVNEPKFHHQWTPDQVDIEQSFPDKPIRQLSDMGYRFRQLPGIGRVELIYLDYSKKRRIHAVADKRGDDCASGY